MSEATSDPGAEPRPDAPHPDAPKPDAGEADLRRGLDQAGLALHAITPVLRHLLGHDDQALFNDAAVARLRGMLADLARQLAQHLVMAEGCDDPVAVGDPFIAELAAALALVRGLLGYLHGLVLEWQAAQHLRAHLGVDPVVSPLLQALIGSSDADTAAIAMKLLAAQARFDRQQEQMRLPLTDLPGDLLHAVLAILPQEGARHGAGVAADTAVATIRAQYDESTTRLGLMARIVTGMGGGAVAALALPHAGVALFTTALALIAGQSRESAVLELTEGQAVRLALTLRATGIKLATVQEVLLALHPASPLAETIAQVPPARAAQMLAAAEESRALVAPGS